MTHSFDTSGEVPGAVYSSPWRWSDLLPGLQSMIGAMIEEVNAQRGAGTPHRPGYAAYRLEPLGFRDIAPATLARLMKDWEGFRCLDDQHTTQSAPICAATATALTVFAT